MDRLALKHRLLITHRCWSLEHKKMIIPCPWCGEEITTRFDAHEYLVKRSGINKQYHDLIFVPENVVPLHHRCHMDHGQSAEMTYRCLYYAARVLGTTTIGQWYVSLWRDHGLSLKKGWLLQPHEVPMHQARGMFDKGYRLLGDGSITDWNIDGVDVRDCAFAQFVPAKKRKAHHKELANCSAALQFTASNQLLVRHARDGYWLDYLTGVLG